MTDLITRLKTSRAVVDVGELWNLCDEAAGALKNARNDALRDAAGLGYTLFERINQHELGGVVADAILKLIKEPKP